MARRDKPRNHPNRKLTEEGWLALHELINTDFSVSVEEHCRNAGVSRGRYYRRFPVGAGGKKGLGGDKSDQTPPTEREPGNTAQGYLGTGLDARAVLV